MTSETTTMRPSDQASPQLPVAEMALPEELLRARDCYSDFRDNHDQGVRIGIFGEDLDRALLDPRTEFIETTTAEGEKVKVPLLVPLDILEWYNIDLLKRTYGEGVRPLYYAHPPISDTEEHDSAVRTLQLRLGEGNVVVADKYQDDETSPIAQLLKEAELKHGGYSVEAFGSCQEGSCADVFVGLVQPSASDGIKPNTPSLRDIYLRAIESGEVEESPTDGIALEQVIEGDIAERIWEIYKEPFDELGENDLSQAGFSKEALLEILADPNIEKFIYRVDGKIVSLSLFFQNFNNCPWFSKESFKKNYPEYFETNNIFILPGIVTDKNMKGGSYSLRLVDFGAKMLARRNTDFLITFECTEVSTAYIPRIVKSAIEKSKVATVTGLEDPVSRVLYRAISKST